MELGQRGLGLIAVGLFACVLIMGAQAGTGPFDWMGYDNFDEIDDRMNSVNAENCMSKPASELRLPSETLAQLPRFNQLLSMIIYPNRTKLLHLHNMALNRAFFYSYIYQKLNESEAFQYQPGLMYFYFSAAADVSANEYNINGSAIMFDNNCSYANWYRNLPFNTTLNLFGARAWRFDDYNEPTNWLREPTNTTLNLEDYGAGSQSNYTTKSYKTNQWYDLWLPDGWDKEGLDSVRKHTYDIGIKYSNETGKFATDEFEAKTIFGPPSPGQRETEHLPVVWTEPYYDCGRSNRWIVSAVAPVLDQLPRYLEWFHLRRFRFVAVSVQDIEFLQVDFNPCPLGIGNEPPNYFHATARCKDSTMCEPLDGWGFRRGGYRCVCKPGYRYPPWQQGPFNGIEIESSTLEEYENGFDCVPVELQEEVAVPKQKVVSKHTAHHRQKRQAFDQVKYDRMMAIIEHKESVNKDNCETFKAEELELPGDVAYGVEREFSEQARTALRLAHFLSNFLQNIDLYEEYGNLRGDKLLNIELLFGEALANVMGDLRIKGSGVFYDIDKFKGPDLLTRQFFGPYAYRYEKEDEGGETGDRANTHFRAIDFAGFENHYLDAPWFKNVKERWQSNTYGLIKYTEKPLIRSDLGGTSLKKFELYPLYYRAPSEKDGWWSAPYFDCNGYVNDWIISYSVPFFGQNSIGSAIEFKGIVRVDIRLDELDINQCPMDFHVPNAFKDTARCHFANTYCEALPGKNFYRGGYKCECRQGWEYPFNDRAWYFDGQTMEEEYRKLMDGETSRYETLKCRISGASHAAVSWMAVLLMLLPLWS
ncbi:hypothetical protein CAPTEDRAFT_161811 [Capitella teleta]|uniref:GPR158/179 extracellular domain-containing protein n=1 Tax=Capitella teleta TaxID=283909 RepID=R7UYH4_CAPTE|nr:hypothetical protein CAPTEDRAFT_161811 [Capitella teleta]|eukprot:ELU11322.1 hypothetical protein CAPTEDRAFT_161811 [Capitella teleta]